jgi:hypothetical protein
MSRERLDPAWEAQHRREGIGLFAVLAVLIAAVTTVALLAGDGLIWVVVGAVFIGFPLIWLTGWLIELRERRDFKREFGYLPK